MPTKSNSVSTSSSKIGGMSNYHYGVRAETRAGEVLAKATNGIAIQSPGSRGSADVTVHCLTRTYDMQCKASRSTTKSEPYCPPAEVSRLVSDSLSKGHIPVISLQKGGHGEIRHAITGQLIAKH